MKFILFFCSLFLLSCGQDTFQERSELGKLRVLGIQANTPEINAAATVNLTTIVSFPQSSGAAINYSWVACPDPGIDFGAEANCDSNTTGISLSGSGSFTPLAGQYYTQDLAGINVVVPAAAFTYLGTLDADTQYNGLNILVLVTLTADGQTTKAIKRIRLSTKAPGDLNTNPSMGVIQSNGVALAAYPTSEAKFSVASLSAPQTYPQETDIGLQTLTENVFVSWYASTGEYLFNRTDPGEDNTFTPSGSTGVFVAIYRDGRGGLAYQINAY
jgi:hypothetical protein